MEKESKVTTIEEVKRAAFDRIKRECMLMPEDTSTILQALDTLAVRVEIIAREPQRLTQALTRCAALEEQVERLTARVKELEEALHSIIAQRPHVYSVPKPFDGHYRSSLDDWKEQCPICKVHIEHARMALAALKEEA